MVCTQVSPASVTPEGKEPFLLNRIEWVPVEPELAFGHAEYDLQAIHRERIRRINRTLPPSFYSQGYRSRSTVPWKPWPGTETEIAEIIEALPDDDTHRLSILSYHGHFMAIPMVTLEYFAQTRKSKKLFVTFRRPQWNATDRKVIWTDYARVPASHGDNDIVRLLEELPGETDIDFDYSHLFPDPDQAEADIRTRWWEAEGEEWSEDFDLVQEFDHEYSTTLYDPNMVNAAD